MYNPSNNYWKERMNMLKRYSILWYVVITVALFFAAHFIPLPVESRALLVPVVLVFVPTVVSVPLAYVTEGKDGLRQLFSKAICI